LLIMFFRKKSITPPEEGQLFLTRNLFSYEKLSGYFFILLIILFTVSLLFGRMEISLNDLKTMFVCWFTGKDVPAELLSKELVFTMVRLPRCLLAVLVGMGLSVSGAVYQALFRNPLVSPDILGVASGCTFGAALGLILPGNNFVLIQGLSFIFGLLAVFFAMSIARMIAVKPILVLVLAGLVVTSLFNAFLMLLKYFSDPYNELPAIVFWVMGSLARGTWKDIYVVFPLICSGVVIVYLLRYRLNILSLGDLQAKALGINPKVYRFIFIVISSLIVALAVSSCGQICWIGLVIPHMARSMVGPDHKKMLPVSALIGSIFLLLADNLARSITSAELPISIITAIIGAPLFTYLLYKNRGSGWI